MPEGKLAGKVALIGGGAGGAGRASSLRFAAEGAKLAIGDLQKDAGVTVVDEIESAGGEALFVQADLSKAADVDSAVGSTLERFGRIDVLFNHAGTFIVKAFHETTEEEWDWLMAVNVKSMFLMCRAVIPSMLERGVGVIVNTSSVSGVTASALESAYCVSKGACLQLSRAIAVEYRGQGIRCNALCPGAIRTPHGLREMEELVKAGVDLGEDGVEVGQVRLCEPEEIASAALFLASDDASFVNGSALFVDNGWTAAT
jgi:NAD(P)-dependent dehydrogenase (short-subunit alcohol dehydrogenase family)